ncbi:hypothetical protein DIZ76_010270 [Coccidioides immitis]|nr:hypothetical protein DIZ76_010270 [Coccidioides immitis]
MTPLLPQHRHQSSLEGIINFSGPKPFAVDERAGARRRFYDIINHFDTTDNDKRVGYRRPRLVRYTYEYSRSELSQDTFLRAFFEFMKLDVAGEEDIDFLDEDLENQLGKNLITFADFLLDNFFLPRLVPIHCPVRHLLTFLQSKLLAGTLHSPPLHIFQPSKEHKEEYMNLLGHLTEYQSFEVLALSVTAIAV